VNVGSGFNATTGVFTAPNTGRYLVSGSASFQSPAETTYACGFSINGGGSLRNGSTFIGPTNFVITVASNGIFDLTASDTVAFQLSQTSGANRNTIANDQFSFFQGFQVATTS